MSAAAELLSLSWDELHSIMERAVKRGLERREWEGLRHVGMDEKSPSAMSSGPNGFGRGQSYVSLLTDLDRARVLEVMKDNNREAADLLLATLPAEVRAAIEAVCIDMARPSTSLPIPFRLLGGHFAAAARAGLPEAALVHDRFHISAHLNDGVAAVHREENRRLPFRQAQGPEPAEGQKLGDDRLKGTQRLFGFDPDKLEEEPFGPELMAEGQAVKFAELKGSDLKSARAWAIKEVFRRFWYYSDEGSARKFFKQWYGWASRSQLKPMIKVAKMLKRHFENIITYLRHPITNGSPVHQPPLFPSASSAVTEGLNSKIQAIKANARGFRSFANYRTRILFFCGKLDLYPL